MAHGVDQPNELVLVGGLLGLARDDWFSEEGRWSSALM
jgi:hypothetical protein